MKQFLSFVRKEFYHIFRDKRTMMILLLMPIILIILFGYAITTEVKQVQIAIYDQSRTPLTERIIERLEANEYFSLYKMVNSEVEVQDLFRKGKVKLVVVFPAQYKGLSDEYVQIQTDATDPNEAQQLAGYATSIIRSELQSSQVQIKEISSPVVVPVVHLLYNPLMKGAYNFVPGVMGLILLLICALMTSVGIVKEKETGTMEILLVSPMKPIFIVIAKMVPYLLLSFINVITILLLSRFLLQVPINGSVTLLIAISVLYSLVSLSLGLLISTVTNTQQAAMLISAVVLMLPVVLLSGMVFPIGNMPDVLQWLSNIVPAKWYIAAVRDVMIKGLGVEAVALDITVLAVMVIFLTTVSVKRFKVRME
ncbi:MAG: ABC transporter permease [Bacteroidaceae bacterium]|nr:ABC transporter permease [Bacteroidaceae bacterium]